MNNEVLEQLDRYMEDGSPESFLTLRQAVAASPDYEPYCISADQALAKVEHGDHAKALAVLRELVQRCFLNPRVHTLLALVNHNLGDEDGARLEFFLGTRFLEGILSTGTGEQSQPYLVLHPIDEYEVLEHLGKKPRRQSLVKTEQGKACDAHECEDESTIWFDVTIPYTRMAASLAKGK